MLRLAVTKVQNIVAPSVRTVIDVHSESQQVRCREALRKFPWDRTEDDLMHISEWLHNVQVRGNEHTHVVLDALAQAITYDVLPAGTVIFRQGDPGDAFYVVFSGVCALLADTGDGKQQVPLEAGPMPENDVLSTADVLAWWKTSTLVQEAGSRDSFGELALTYDQPRAATAVVVRRAELLRVGRANYNRHLRHALRMTVGAKMDFLRRSLRAPVGSQGHSGPLAENTLRRVAFCFVPLGRSRGAVLVERGAPTTRVYIVRRGEVALLAQGGAVATLGVGDMFGALEAAHAMCLPGGHVGGRSAGGAARRTGGRESVHWASPFTGIVCSSGAELMVAAAANLASNLPSALLRALAEHSRRRTTEWQQRSVHRDETLRGREALAEARVQRSGPLEATIFLGPDTAGKHVPLHGEYAARLQHLHRQHLARASSSDGRVPAKPRKDGLLPPVRGPERSAPASPPPPRKGSTHAGPRYSEATAASTRATSATFNPSMLPSVRAHARFLARTREEQPKPADAHEAGLSGGAHAAFESVPACGLGRGDGAVPGGLSTEGRAGAFWPEDAAVIRAIDSAVRHRVQGHPSGAAVS